MKSYFIGFFLALIASPHFFTGNGVEHPSLIERENKIWFVRPKCAEGYTQPNDPELGLSYDKAFNGFSGIDQSGIRPGDTIYICGFHDGNDRETTILPFRLSGEPGQPITISGDWPNDPGIIFGSGPHQRFSHRDSVRWEDVGNHVYRKFHEPSPSEVIAMAFEKNSDGHVVRLKNDGSNISRWTPGSFNYNKKEKAYYYKPTSAAPADSFIFYTGFSPSLIQLVSGNHDIVVRHIAMMNCFGSGGFIQMRTSADSLKLPIHDILIGNMALRWATKALRFSGSKGKPAHHITIKNSMIRDCHNGIYPDGEIKNIEISGNEIFDINQDGSFGRGDSHAFGLYGGGDSILIAHNHIHHVGGEGIIFYIDKRLYYLTNVAICYNYIHDVVNKGPHKQNQRGIEIGGDDRPSSQYHNRIYYNIVLNTGGAGLRLKTPYSKNLRLNSWDIYNNVICSAAVGLTAHPVSGSILGFNLQNNIFLNSRDEHIDIQAFSDNITMDHNIYFPDGASKVKITGAITFSGSVHNWIQWNTASAVPSFDTHSLVVDPMFADSSFISDQSFKINSQSSARHAGINAGITSDYFGNRIETTPDIGVYQVDK